MKYRQEKLARHFVIWFSKTHSDSFNMLRAKKKERKTTKRKFLVLLLLLLFPLDFKVIKLKFSLKAAQTQQNIQKMKESRDNSFCYVMLFFFNIFAFKIEK